MAWNFRYGTQQDGGTCAVYPLCCHNDIHNEAIQFIHPLNEILLYYYSGQYGVFKFNVDSSKLPKLLEFYIKYHTDFRDSLQLSRIELTIDKGVPLSFQLNNTTFFFRIMFQPVAFTVI